MKKCAFFCAAMLTGAALAAPLAAQTNNPMNSTPFDASASSLQRYQTPAWFRDAKFGIWSHWGPQAVPRQGDWYARNMYIQGSSQYEYHLKTYGHPTIHGYKDIIPLWKAEKWNPDELMDLYVKSGAKYFVSMGVHHDNFDLWNSHFHSWNAVKMGPHRDIVGQWQAAAKKRGLPFGVSEHLAASYSWFQVSHGSDKTGPLAGIPYDGADPNFQELYHTPVSDASAWYTENPAAQREWKQRIEDLIDIYHPDLLYSDGGIPFGEVGRSVIAHFYNSNRALHNGHLEAVYNYKNIGSGEFIEGAGVLDVERGGLQQISPLPWQTDTSIGDWFYSENYRYKTADEVIHLLADTVSKNGNLLLNVVQYADGSLPPQSQQFLQQMAVWMPINGEAIYGTRPWKVFGEGPTQMETGNFREDFPFSARDIRFTTKNGALYAITLGVPREKVVIRALSSDAPLVKNDPTRVELLGYNGKLNWQRTAKGLEIEVPPNLNLQHAYAFKMSGLQSAAVAPDVAEEWQRKLTAPQIQIVQADAKGAFDLTSEAAITKGGLRVEGPPEQRNIGFWNDARDFIAWQIEVKAPGKYRLALDSSAANNGTDFVVEIGDQQLAGRSTATGDWTNYQTLDLGAITIEKVGLLTVKIRAADAQNWQPFNVRELTLTRE